MADNRPSKMTTDTLIRGDCLEVMAGMEPGSVDLVFGSPPYELQRDYGIGFDLKGEEWVAWMVKIVQAALRITKGMAGFVVDGPTEDFEWSATPAMLMADLKRCGVCLRRPNIFHRNGVPGSGGPDWFRNDYEFIVCATHGGRLPWSDVTACGHPPKYAPGGEMSHRLSNGERVNQWGGAWNRGHWETHGRHKATTSGRISPSHVVCTVGERVKRIKASHRPAEKTADGAEEELQAWKPPAIANPGNVIKCKVGGGHMGHRLAHENEAPFPEELVERFVLSFCPPAGTVLDPFVGSGTTCAVAKRHGRHWIGIDVRESQVQIARQRIKETQAELFV